MQAGTSGSVMALTGIRNGYWGPKQPHGQGAAFTASQATREVTPFGPLILRMALVCFRCLLQKLGVCGCPHFNRPAVEQHAETQERNSSAAGGRVQQQPQLSMLHAPCPPKVQESQSGPELLKN